ncbi:MAG: hypothetical protein ROM54_09725 [Anaerobiospirillum sp.]|nr:hypothetical protein [Anaerobiospirillum sp.]
MMQTNAWWRDLLFYLAVIVLFSLLYALLSHLPGLDYLSVVFYYRMNWALLLTVVVAGLLLWGGRKYLTFSIKDAICSLLIAVLLNFAFLSLILVSLDRSISVYLISYMASHEEQSFTIPELEHIFLSGYVEGSGAMARRMKEQRATGTVEEIAPHVYQISTGGKRMVALWQVLAEIYPVDQQFLYPKELTELESQL